VLASLVTVKCGCVMASLSYITVISRSSSFNRGLPVVGPEGAKNAPGHKNTENLTLHAPPIFILNIAIILSLVPSSLQSKRSTSLCLRKRMLLSKTALALLVLLSCSLESSVSFTSPLRRNLQASAPTSNLPLTDRTQQRMVASTEPTSVADMQRGIGGRLEDAFESAKERGEAALVTFVTAGYPRAEGKAVPLSSYHSDMLESFSYMISASCFAGMNFRHSGYPVGHARGRRLSD